MFYTRKTGPRHAPSLDQIQLTQNDPPSLVDLSDSSPLSLAATLKENCVWMDFESPTMAALDQVAALFPIHSLSLQDIKLAQSSADAVIEKAEQFPAYIYLCIKSCNQDLASPGGSFLSPQYLQILVFTLEQIHDVSPKTSTPLSAEWVCPPLAHIAHRQIAYTLLDDIIDAFPPLIKYLEFEADAIDDMVLLPQAYGTTPQPEMLSRIAKSRKMVLLLTRLCQAKPALLRHACKLFTSTQMSVYLGDTLDHALTTTHSLMHMSKALSRSHSNYLARVSIEITRASNKTNDAVVWVTALAGVLIPLNVVTGLWGMNVKVPGQDVDSLNWFFGICGGLVGLGGATFLVLRRAIS
ncbi:MAG: hypothetical protein SGCHY_000507 [Lobulomycetales sp.]